MAAYAVGAGMALAVAMFARGLGLDRDRAFYPTVLAVVASYYALFAVMGGSRGALLQELAAALVFLVLVVTGVRRSLWLVVLGLALHGVFDLVHARIIADPGVPAFWPPFCMAYDVTAAIVLGWMLHLGVGARARMRHAR